jgi:hypothetical protein
MKKFGFLEFAVVLLVSSQCNGSSFNDFTSESAGNSGGYEAEHNLIARQVRDITGYAFKDETLLGHVFTRIRSPESSKSPKLEFFGETVIKTILTLNTFNLASDEELLQTELANKTNNIYLADRSKEIGLNVLMASDDLSDIAPEESAKIFKSLIGAMQLDSEHHPSRISIAATSFVLTTFNLPVSTRTSKKVNPDKIAEMLAYGRCFLTMLDFPLLSQSEIQNMDKPAEIINLVRAIFKWWTKIDYQSKYQECRLWKNVYFTTTLGLTCYIFWPYIASIFFSKDTNTGT